MQDTLAAPTRRGAGLRVGLGDQGCQNVPGTLMSPSLLLCSPQNHVVPRAWPQNGGCGSGGRWTQTWPQRWSGPGCSESTGQGACTPDLGGPCSLPGALGKFLPWPRGFHRGGTGPWPAGSAPQPSWVPGSPGVRVGCRRRGEVVAQTQVGGQRGGGLSARHSGVTPQTRFCGLCFPGA